MSKNSKDVSSQVSEQPRHRFSLAETVFTTEEAAEYLRISRAGLYRLVTAKKITSTHIGDRTVFKGRELARYVDFLA